MKDASGSEEHKTSRSQEDQDRMKRNLCFTWGDSTKKLKEKRRTATKGRAHRRGLKRQKFKAECLKQEKL
ncbi:hypothetical protein GRJ2_001212500 [Grus japonensis]|uniref:Uncharacterized protein n=1 Tax=Grus japonensis TaxID=30415 RepID=A0ABC9WQU5_GRUJA